jgi:hypothetical protein
MIFLPASTFNDQNNLKLPHIFEGFNPYLYYLVAGILIGIGFIIIKIFIEHLFQR